MTIDLRLGRWQDVLAGETCDSLIGDAPYGPRTHKGYRTGELSAGGLTEARGVFEYPPLTLDDVAEFVASWAPRVRRWVCLFGDDVTSAWWKAAWSNAGWYTFAPLAWVKEFAPPRVSGEGPQSSTERIALARSRMPVDEEDEEYVSWLLVARPRSVQRDGSRQGHYLVSRVEGDTNGSLMPGQKNLAAMRKLVRDYTKAGDRVIDPYAGTGTTLLACALEGRRCLGAEQKPETFEMARRRLVKALPDDVVATALAREGDRPVRVRAKQMDAFAVAKGGAR